MPDTPDHIQPGPRFTSRVDLRPLHDALREQIEATDEARAYAAATIRLAKAHADGEPDLAALEAETDRAAEAFHARAARLSNEAREKWLAESREREAQAQLAAAAREYGQALEAEGLVQAALTMSDPFSPLPTDLAEAR